MKITLKSWSSIILEKICDDQERSPSKQNKFHFFWNNEFFGIMNNEVWGIIVFEGSNETHPIFAFTEILSKSYFDFIENFYRLRIKRFCIWKKLRIGDIKAKYFRMFT